MIRIYEPHSQEVKNLARVADIMTARSDNGVVYKVGDTYFDFGQDWKWTTILAYRKNESSWQALTPAEQEKIVLAKPDELDAVAQALMNKCEKEYPSLYSFRKSKRVWNILVSAELTTSFSIEAETADDAEELFKEWAWDHSEEIYKKLTEELRLYSLELSYPTKADDGTKPEIKKEDI